MLNLKTGLVIGGLGALLVFPAHAQADLSKKVDELEQELRILKRQLELDKEVSTEKAKTTPVLSAGAGGFSFRSADTNFVLKVRGYIQADARFYPGEPGVASNDTFLLRRVRPILEGTLYDKFDYRLMLDFGSRTAPSTANDPYVQDAYVNARFFPWLQVQAGKFKEPVDLERLQSGSNLLFVERGYPTVLGPNRDVGVQLQGEVLNSSLTYALGVFNGVSDNASGDFDAADGGKDLAARVFATPFKDSNVEVLRGFGVGVGSSIGNQEQAPGNAVTPGQQTFFSYTTAAGVVHHGEHWRLAPQGYYYYGPFGLLGEYIISESKLRRNAAPTATLRARNTAWMVAASYYLTGEDNSYKPVTPKRAFDPLNGGGWGAFEIAARIQQLDIDDKLFPTFASAATSASGATSWGVGLNWYLNKNLKFNLDYEDTDFKGGTTAFLQKGEQVILTRAQVSF